jgi:hypothetical protein
MLTTRGLCLSLAIVLVGCFDFPESLLGDFRRGDSVIKDSVIKDGVTRDGATRNKPAGDGPAEDGAKKDGPGNDGPAKDARKDVKKVDVKPPQDATVLVDVCGPCPAGWTALVYSARSPTAPAVGCPVGWKGFSTPVAMEGLTDPGCSQCTCGAPAGRTCTATFECQHNASCTSKSNCSASNTIPGDNNCFDFGCDNICSHARVTASGPSGGTCAKSGGAVQAHTWAKAHDLCVPSGANWCQAVCVPASTFSGCIVKAGDTACPAGFGSRQVFHADVTDTRTCSACTCGPPLGGSCASTATLYPCTNCGIGATGGKTVGACMLADASVLSCNGTDPLIRSARYAGISTNPGQCAPAGGVKSGSVTPTGAVTVCCP